MAKNQFDKNHHKSLTLDELVRYNQEVLFPALDDKFAKIDDNFAKVSSNFIKIDERFDKVDKEIEEKFDKIMTGQDKILKSIEDLKSDNTAGIEAQKRQNEKLENHETRIKVVERRVGITATK
jgi:DNA anti-recombination protein RmuC